MQYIASYIDLFSVNQPIYLVQENETPQLVATVPIDMVGSTVAQFCASKNIENAYLFGQEDFLSPIVDSIMDIYKTHYSNKNIKVEVNV